MIDLDAIEARANEATPGPWVVDRYDTHRVFRRTECGPVAVADAGLHEDSTGNAAFIASARTDVPALIARVRELEAERERMKTFAAQNFSAMLRQEAEQMREYGLSYEGVRKVLREHDDGEISFGKLMDLIRAAARAMAEDMNK